MRGTQDTPGIIPLAVHDVFKNLEKAVDREFLLRMSYMEIYNEDINDLLAPEQTKLQVHESLERGIFVAGLREEIVANPEQVLQLMDFGEAHRHVGETNMNVHSSRSHTIFRMVIESRDKSQDDSVGFSCDAVRVSVLNLVDLAGSERVAKTGAEGARLKEGTHINKSLMVLGTVINKLSEGIQNQGGHIPYRDSKLTRILQPSLGGNARTAIICNITPALVHVDESKGTLQFASRAIHVTNCAQVNEVLTDAALLKRQKKEIEELRSKLKESHSEHLEEEILTLRNTLLKSECERERIAMELEEEKRAHAERERRQAQKIENLSSLVLNSAVEDREFEKRSKRNTRRETWCPTLKSSCTLGEDASHFTREDIWDSQRRDWTSSMPPPFESLLEEESMCENDNEEELVSDEQHQGQKDFEENTDRGSDSLPSRSARMHVVDRKRKHVRGRCSDGFQDELDFLKREAHASTFQVSAPLSQVNGNFGIEKERDGMKQLGDQDVEGLLDSLRKENEKLVAQLTDAYMQLEEERAVWAATCRSNNEQSRERSTADHLEISAQFKAEGNEQLTERVKELENMIVSLKADKEENECELRSLKGKLLELQKEVDAASMSANQAMSEKDAATSEVLAVRAKIDQLEHDLDQEKTLREMQGQELLQLRNKLASTQELLDIQNAESRKENWILKTEILKLQFCIDATNAKSEVYLGRLLEARDELKDVYEELDHVKGLKRKQTNEASFPLEILKLEKQDDSMSDTAQEKSKKVGCFEAETVRMDTEEHINVNEQVKSCVQAQEDSLYLGNAKAEPIEREKIRCSTDIPQVDEARVLSGKVAHTVCIPVRSVAAKQQEPCYGNAVAPMQSRRRLSTLNGNVAPTRLTGGLLSLPTLKKDIAIPISEGRHHACSKPPKPMPGLRNSLRPRSVTVNKENK
ncbi:hypothetical protein KP509_21G061300 [Ceratopteris richardii]|nr:hypothetical protein KP509_21G061300 [Ceratopteris richardii]